jgi:hypothetical protein
MLAPDSYNGGVTMAGDASQSDLRNLQEEIENFIRAQSRPAVAEDEAVLFDLTAASWRLNVAFDKLIFEIWNASRSLARRVEDVAYRDRGRLGLYVRKSAGKATSTLEIRDLAVAPRPATGEARGSYQAQLLAMLGRQFPGWKFERVSHRTDREHAFSGLYTRGVARRGMSAWAFLGLPPEEVAAAADAFLAHGVNWLDALRSGAGKAVVGGLKLFAPRPALDLLAHRAAYLNPRTLQIEVFEWQPSDAVPTAIDLRDFGNVATRLAPRRQVEDLLQRHASLVKQLAGGIMNALDIIPSPAADALSVRVLGLEVARIEGLLAPRVFFGLEGNVRRFKPELQKEFQDMLARVLEYRRPDSPQRDHEFYRRQAERWLESLLVRDISRVDPALRPEFVYQQVPAFTGQDRGVIDILSVTVRGRLAVIELKLDEDINLPFQGLDYWLRVRWLQQSGDFQRSGYFPGLQLSDAPPLLYLVSPAFRFHSTSDRLVRYIAPSVEIIKVGVNQQWRNRVEVLFRHKAGSF